MREFFQSAFFVLTVLALVSGIAGALASGMWDYKPIEGQYSYGNLFAGAKFGIIWAWIGLVPYWLFHAAIRDIFQSWRETKYKIWRVSWVVIWAGFLAWYLSLAMGI